MGCCDCKRAIVPPRKVCVDEFLPEVNVVLPEAPSQLVRRYLIDGAIQFAQETQALVREYRFFPQGKLRRYYIEPDADEQVHKVITACFEGTDYRPDREGVGYAFCYAYGGEWRFLPPALFEVSDPPECDTSECVVVRYAAMPKRDATHIDLEFHERHREAIVAYAIYKLGMTQGDTKNPYPFFSPQLAKEHEKIFRREVAATKTHVMGAYLSGGRPLGRSEARYI